VASWQRFEQIPFDSLDPLNQANVSGLSEIDIQPCGVDGFR
jgi:hypothetical protein